MALTKGDAAAGTGVAGTVKTVLEAGQSGGVGEKSLHDAIADAIAAVVDDLTVNADVESGSLIYALNTIPDPAGGDEMTGVTPTILTSGGTGGSPGVTVSPLLPLKALEVGRVLRININLEVLAAAAAATVDIGLFLNNGSTRFVLIRPAPFTVNTGDAIDFEGPMVLMSVDLIRTRNLHAIKPADGMRVYSTAGTDGIVTVAGLNAGTDPPYTLEVEAFWDSADSGNKLLIHGFTVEARPIDTTGSGGIT